MNHSPESLTKFESGDILRYAVLGTTALLSLIPFIYMFLLSFMSQSEATNPSKLWPSEFSWQNYQTAWDFGNFWFYGLNTILITLFSTLGQVVFCALAGYAFASIPFRGKRAAFALILVTLMVPEAVLITPSFAVIKGQVLGISFLNLLTLTMIFLASLILFYAAFGLLNNYMAKDLPVWSLSFLCIGLVAVALLITLVLIPDFREGLRDELWPKSTLLNTYQVMILPFIGNAYSMFLFRQFFVQLPEELWHAARIDGANHLQYFVRVVVPLSIPAFATISVLAFIWSWNAYAWPILTQTGTEPKFTLAVGLRELSNDYAADVPAQMAGAALVILPVLIVYSIAIRQFTQSLSRVGLK